MAKRKKTDASPADSSSVAEAERAPEEAAAAEPTTPSSPSSWQMGLRFWAQAYRVELTLFAVVFSMLAMFSSQRFWRQSAAPHFVYQAKAFLEGRLDLDVEVLPNNEDWACVREVGGVKQRCTGAITRSDRWYSSFPWFPSVVMLPFVAVNGYQLNDTSFGVIVGALAIALLYALFRLLADREGTGLPAVDNAGWALAVAFGTVFFYAALRGEVWFSAEVMGVAFTALYLRSAVGARRPVLAGVFWSMAVLTRTPLFFTGVFFVLEALAPKKESRVAQLLSAGANQPGLKALRDFALGAAPLGVVAAVINQVRFGSLSEFGHRFLYNNRVNVDIDTYGLFHWHYLERNLDAAFLKLPLLEGGRLSYSPWGLSLFLTLPVLALAVTPSLQPRRALGALAAMAGVLVGSAVFPGGPDIGGRPAPVLVALVATLGLLVWLAREWLADAQAPRLLAPTLVTLLACALPGLLYQNSGYAQFGFRFSLDYTPYVVMLAVLGGWRLRQPVVMAVLAVAGVVNFWGAVAFRGFTEGVRQWP